MGTVDGLKVSSPCVRSLPLRFLIFETLCVVLGVCSWICRSAVCLLCVFIRDLADWTHLLPTPSTSLLGLQKQHLPTACVKATVYFIFLTWLIFFQTKIQTKKPSLDSRPQTSNCSVVLKMCCPARSKGSWFFWFLSSCCSSSSSSHLITVAATQPVASPAFKFWIPRLFPPHCSLCSSIPARRRAIKQPRTSRQVSDAAPARKSNQGVGRSSL